MVAFLFVSSSHSQLQLSKPIIFFRHSFFRGKIPWVSSSSRYTGLTDDNSCARCSLPLLHFWNIFEVCYRLALASHYQPA